MFCKSLIGKATIHFERVKSTNLTAVGLMQSEMLEEGSIITTSFQENGKGQNGNFWESESGKNLLVSVILKPVNLHPAKQFILNKIVSLAIAGFVKPTVVKRKVKIKWPNDIYVDSKKIAGILINNTIKGNVFDHSIVGIGININQQEFLSDAPNPVSIRSFVENDLDLNKCLIQLCDALNFWYRKLVRKEYEDIDKSYINSLYRFNEFHPYKINGNIIISKIVGISEYGKLQLETEEQKVYECDLKEVEFVL
ncbi:MAG: biotin--[acetyl-CoA-carboxylase] ligase [Bacteroidetes bacterium]|nr:biotin--[acetyl-CoA-carboxylase] ligase [Bacteroidota bacterium]